MTAALLSTRYHRPSPPPDLVARPRLTRLLDAGFQSRLILIAAPAGFGKTSLLAEWLWAVERAGREGPAEASGGVPGRSAWLALDPGDTTLAGFWAYVIAAIQTAAPQVGLTALAALQAPQPAPIEAVLTTLINDLAGLAEPLTLVLDDYHLITTTAIHQSLDYLLAHLPPTLRLVIATREDPPLALARLRARGQLTELRADDLRFSAAESEAFLNDARALGLAPADVARLAERAEGWITGLRLAALSLQQADDPHGFIAAFSASHRFVADYLVDEVLARLDPALQRFLRRTALLRRLCAPLCDAVLGEPGSQRQLQLLEQANLFVAPLDHARHWYRYHHLFAEFLRMELRASEPELVPLLFQRAIAWCRAEGLLREALGYALDARDDDQAADVLEVLAPRLLSDEGPDAVIQWCAALPPPLVGRRPRLAAAYAWALTGAGRMEEAAALLDAAEAAAAPADGDDGPALRGQIATHRAYLLLFRGAFAEAETAAREALAHLPHDDLVLRTRAALVLSSVLRFAGRLVEAEAALAMLGAASRTGASVATTTTYWSSLGSIRHVQGRLREALECFRQALAAAERQTGRADTPFTGFAQVAIGRLEWEWGDLDAALASVARGVDSCRAWQQADTLAIGLVELVRLHLSRGEHELAGRAMGELRQIAGLMDSPWGVATADAWQALLDVARGDVAAVRRWLEQHAGLADGPPSAGWFDDWPALVQALLACGEPAAALHTLDPLIRRLRAEGRSDPLLEALVWRARALADLGRAAEASDALAEALALGEPEGYVQRFVAGGPPIAELLRALGAKHGGPSVRQRQYVARLLAALPASDPAGAGPGRGAGRSAGEQPVALSEPLSERELAVLRLMAAGLANREIGDTLYLSVNTVRWYASQIFAKLGVGSRGAAVARARELGLV